MGMSNSVNTIEYRAAPRPQLIPLWLKISYTLFVAVLVPAYIHQYPLANFLWSSDVALLLTVAGLWMESRLILTMQTVSLTIPETFWSIDFFLQLLGFRAFGMTDYMFNAQVPLLIRGLSLFHLFLPPMLWWMTLRLKPHPRGWLAQTALGWVVLLVCYFFTDPKLNINWTFGPGHQPQTAMPSWLYLGIAMLSLPLLSYGPSQLLLNYVARRRA
jgi:hypothetical protein